MCDKDDKVYFTEDGSNYQSFGYDKNYENEIQNLRETIGKKIRSERERLGITIEQFAESADLSSSFVGLLERGDRLPSIKTSFIISKVLNLPISHIFGEEDKTETKGQEENIILDFYIRQLNIQQKKKLEKLISIMFLN